MEVGITAKFQPGWVGFFDDHHGRAHSFLRSVLKAEEYQDVCRGRTFENKRVLGLDSEVLRVWGVSVIAAG